MRFSLSVFILLSALLTFAACSPSHTFELTSGPDPDVFWKSQPLNYQTLKSKIVDLKCVGCHNIDNTTGAGEILFDTYEALMNDEFGRWNPPAESSRILRSLTRNDRNRMPPPKWSEALSKGEIDFISRWIDAGRPEF